MAIAAIAEVLLRALKDTRDLLGFDPDVAELLVVIGVLLHGLLEGGLPFLLDGGLIVGGYGWGAAFARLWSLGCCRLSRSASGRGGAAVGRVCTGLLELALDLVEDDGRRALFVASETG